MSLPIEAPKPKRIATEGIQVGRVERFILLRVALEGDAVADVALSTDEAVSVAAAILFEREKLVRETQQPSRRLYLPMH